MPRLAVTVPKIDRPKLNDRLPIQGAVRSTLIGMLRGALDAGLQRLVVPAAGDLLIPLMAREAGWPADQIEASDISFPSVVTGFAASGKDMKMLVTSLDGESHPDMLDPAFLLWSEAVERAREEAANGSYSAALVLKHLLATEAQHRAGLTQQFLTLREGGYSLLGMGFSPCDPTVHLGARLDDEGALIVLRPPTETRPALRGRLEWDEPRHTEWDSKVDLPRWADSAREAPALVLLVHAAAFGSSLLPPMAGNAADDKRVVYLGVNQPARAAQILPTKRTSHRPEPLAAPGPWPILGTATDTDPDGDVDLVLLNRPQARYYRRLWSSSTRALPGAPYIGFLIGGHLAAVVALDKSWVDRGRMGDLRFPDDTLELTVLGASPARTERLARLAARLARCQEIASRALEEPTRSLAKRVRVEVELRDGEPDDYAGTYKLLDTIQDEKEPTKRTLFYEAILDAETPQQAYQAWLYQEWRAR